MNEFSFSDKYYIGVYHSDCDISQSSELEFVGALDSSGSVVHNLEYAKVFDSFSPAIKFAQIISTSNPVFNFDNNYIYKVVKK